MTREDDYWVAQVAGLRGGATEARRWRDLENEVRDLIAGLTDVDEQSFDLVWHFDLPGEAMTHLRDWEDLKRQRARIDAEYRSVASRVVTSMRKLDISQRDAADLLGISHQRVSQLMAQAKHETASSG